MTTIGKLRHLVEIQQRSGAKDELNQPLPDAWSVVGHVWADVQHPKGLEALKADQPRSVVSASIRVRYGTPVAAGMRVLHEGRTYQVQAVLPDDGSRRWMDLVCETGVRGG